MYVLYMTIIISTHVVEEHSQDKSIINKHIHCYKAGFLKSFIWLFCDQPDISYIHQN